MLSVQRAFLCASALAATLSACRGQAAPSAAPADDPIPSIDLPPGSEIAPVLSPQEALESFHLPPGYRVEIVAAEPLVEDPVAIDFDPDGRMYVAEMRGYMRNIEGTGEGEPIGRVVVLEDTNDDGRMDRRTVFMDSIALPRSVRVLQHGILIAATPYVWLARDTDGDLRADTREVVRDDYGNPQSNPEHNANGLLWGLDNWIHNANYAGQFRLRDGRFEYRRSPSLGQWYLSMNDYGRIFRNSNEDPLRADLVPSHYAARNPNLQGMRGVHERLTTNVPVWPAHPTPAVNRGYRPQTLRADSTLAHYTAAGSPTAYVGDRLPAELRNTVFISEPSGNLVGQFVVQENEHGIPTARRAQERVDFLASTDERFRPVNLATAPDGTLYVVDMYRGIIQHRVFITGYLEQQIKARGLEQPVGLGRIYRIVHESTPRGPKPQLSRASSAQLVQHLSHPNGWWRITAQRLLVERRDQSVVPALRRLARSAPDDRARLHALWTLEGLEAADAATLQEALKDASSHVRAAAIRISEPALARAGDPLQASVLRMIDDRAPEVRRQLALSLGELPVSEREVALAAVVARHGGDPLIPDLVVSGLHQRELPFLERLLASAGAQDGDYQGTVRALASAVVRSRDAGAVQRLLTLAGEPSRPRWQRLALLEGVQLAQNSGRRGGGGGPALELPSRPASLIAAMESADTALSSRAHQAAAVLNWPGKPSAQPSARTLTAEEQQRFADGQQLYSALCAGCHQANGAGLAGVARSLVGSPWVEGTPSALIRILLHGKEGEMLMPPVGGSLSDEQNAAVLTYIRRAWGNDASPVAPAEVREVRGAFTGRNRPWTEDELRSSRR